MDEDYDETTMDACLIAAGQRAEHYEMAVYGTLIAWARAMGHDDAAGLLQETLRRRRLRTKSSHSLLKAASTSRRQKQPTLRPRATRRTRRTRRTTTRLSARARIRSEPRRSRKRHGASAARCSATGLAGNGLKLPGGSGVPSLSLAGQSWRATPRQLPHAAWLTSQITTSTDTGTPRSHAIAYLRMIEQPAFRPSSKEACPNH